MRRAIIGIVAAVLFIITCGDDKSTLIDTNSNSNSGTTKTFQVIRSNVDCLPRLTANDTEAQRFCVSLGYQEAKSYTYTLKCYYDNYVVETSYPGWLKTVTCWKP